MERIESGHYRYDFSFEVYKVEERHRHLSNHPFHWAYRIGAKIGAPFRSKRDAMLAAMELARSEQFAPK